MSADHLFYVSRANIFSVYPKILKEILICEELARMRESLSATVCFLPSDFEWQMRMYFWLLERQKIINAYAERGEIYHDTSYKHNKILWESIDLTAATPVLEPSPDPIWTESVEESMARRRPRCVSYDLLSYCNADEINLWDLHDYNCAGKLLMRPQMVVDFVDEYEMRKVYSLIYDVYRYKLVLNQALLDVELFNEHPSLADEQPRVWLLLFELHCRKFSKRDPEATKIMNQLFVESRLLAIEAILWKYKTRLAASLTRLRIQSNALVLSQLLPKHLQDNKVALAVSCPILTGFVNNFKGRITKKQVIVTLQDLGYIELEDDGQKLKKNEYKWDKICPQFLTIYPVNRNKFVNSHFMTNSEFIIQDRGFSLGPAMFAKLLDLLDLRGDVVQTHVLSPRSTAYLASLLMNNDRVNRFIVFGAGNKLEELQRFMAKLSVTNITFIVDSFTETTLTASILQRAVAIFATPPSSFSGISDPIDLICSRGGDLSMLEVLSESEMTYAGQERVSQVLTEQRETLKKAMSRSYTQYILYETHSLVQSENEEMVQKTIEFMNRKARDKHVRVMKEKEKEKEKHNFAPAVAEIVQPSKKVKQDPRTRFRETIFKVIKRQASGNEPTAGTESEGDTESGKLKQLQKSQNIVTEEDYARVKVPDTDLFCVQPLPDLCQNRDRCLDLAGQGCYLALLQRKDIVRLDSKYLIKMAEVRGIFGDTDKSKKTKSSSQKRMEKKAEEMKLAAKESKSIQRSDSTMVQLIERLNAPTLASTKRGHFHRVSTAAKQFLVVDLTHACQRHARRHRRWNIDDSVVTYMQMVRESEQSRMKRCWHQAVEHIGRLRARGDVTADCLDKAKDWPLVLKPAKSCRRKKNRVGPKAALAVPVKNLEFQVDSI